MFNIQTIRKDFPILSRSVYDKPLVYLDNAASSQCPQVVIDRIKDYQQQEHANIHRGVHFLSQTATSAYEGARKKIQTFINAKHSQEVVFVRGGTEAVNLVASSFGHDFKAGDEIIISHMEHHSNIVPWQMLCQRTGAILKVIPIDDKGDIIMKEYEKLISDKTRIVSIVHVSNSLGTVNPVKQVIDIAHQKNIPVLIDGCQAIQHSKVDVQDLDADFYVFSGHKMYAPSGIGVLYAKKELLDAIPPYQGGGDMILSVSFDNTKYAELPAKFEAGTPNIVGAIGLGAAIDYLQSLDWDSVMEHEKQLLEYATNALKEIPQLTIIGEADKKVSVLSFILEGVHPHDIGTIVDQEGVAIRTGHHCTEPVMKRYGINGTSRASIAIYNTKEDIDALTASIHTVLKIFGNV
jgi:cysteine desulfurase/selenocysteine lyase